MAKFRKKPVVIEAEQVPPSKDLDYLERWGRLAAWMQMGKANFVVTGKGVDIKTLEGTMTADPNDWIIKGVKGEFYPCKPDIFEATYEAVNQ